jgi:hypothetical protein
MKIFNILIIALILLSSFSDEDKEVRLQRKDCEILREILINKEGKLDIHVSEDSIFKAFDDLHANLDVELPFIESRYNSTIF